MGWTGAVAASVLVAVIYFLSIFSNIGVRNCVYPLGLRILRCSSLLPADIAVARRLDISVVFFEGNRYFSRWEEDAPDVGGPSAFAAIAAATAVNCLPTYFRRATAAAAAVVDKAKNLTRRSWEASIRPVLACEKPNKLGCPRVYVHCASNTSAVACLIVDKVAEKEKLLIALVLVTAKEKEPTLFKRDELQRGAEFARLSAGRTTEKPTRPFIFGNVISGSLKLEIYVSAIYMYTSSVRSRVSSFEYDCFAVSRMLMIRCSIPLDLQPRD